MTDKKAFLQLNSGCSEQPRTHLINSSSLLETREKFIFKIERSVFEKICL